MADIPNPHDAFFKELLARPETARDFAAHYLPPAVTAALDLSTLVATRDSFVDAELRAHCSDLLFRVALRSGGSAFLYLLFEHKSRPDRFARFQLLRYTVRFWEGWHRDHPRATLPPVLPVLFYHGRTRWKVSARFRDLVACPQGLRPYVPDFVHHLCDLSVYSDGELRGEAVLRAGLLALKHVFSADVSERLPAILGLLRGVAESPTGLAALEVLLRYLASAADAVDEPALQRALEQTFPAAGGTLMPTLMEQWTQQARQQGRQQGRQEGRQQGRQEGRQEGEAALLLRQAGRKFGPLPEKVCTLVDQADSATLLRWGERILSARTLEEVFED